MRTDVIARLRKAMAAAGLDALVAISPENFAYATGFVVPSQPLMRWRHAICAVTADGRTGVVCVDMEETTVRGRLPDQDIRVWGEFTDRPMDALARLLMDMGAGEGRIGIEFNYLPAGDYEQIGALLPDARFEPADALFDRMRQIKTADEIALLRRLSRISDTAIAESFRAVTAGKTEMDMAGALTRSVYAQGAEQFKLMIVATGERSRLPNVGPSERILQPGDVCRVEIFSIIGGYHAGVCRTAAVTRVRPEAARIWANLVECKYLVLDMIRPGASARAIYEAFLGKFGELGLPPISFVGHGIGLHLHEEPYLGKYRDYEIEAGMVLGIEPLVYRTGMGFGLQLKDMVAVTETGAELLSDVTDTDTLFPIQ
jgi:Xaa-Pro aminopeptidase